MDPETGHKTAGRPRDATIDDRILGSALELYAERGWFGLTLHGISRHAGVGKAALYARWSTTSELLRDAFARFLSYRIATELPIRDFLVVEAHIQAQLKLGRFAGAASRLMIEGRNGPPDLRQIHVAVTGSRISTLRTRVEEAIASGELPPGTSATRLLDALEGTMYMHISVTPERLLERMLAQLPDYITATVDSLLFLADHGMLDEPRAQVAKSPGELGAAAQELLTPLEWQALPHQHRNPRTKSQDADPGLRRAPVTLPH